MICDSLTSTVSGASVEYTSGSPETSLTTISNVTSGFYPINIRFKGWTKYSFWKQNDLTGSTTYLWFYYTRNQFTRYLVQLDWHG